MGATYEPVATQDEQPEKEYASVEKNGATVDEKSVLMMPVPFAVPMERKPRSRRALVLFAVGALVALISTVLLFNGCGRHRHPFGPGMMSPAQLNQKLMFSEVVGSALQTYYRDASSTYDDQVQCFDCMQEEIQSLRQATVSSILEICATTTNPALSKFCEFHSINEDMSPLVAFAKADADFLGTVVSRCATAGPCRANGAVVDVATNPVFAKLMEQPHGGRAHFEAAHLFRMASGPRSLEKENDESTCQECVSSGLANVRASADEQVAHLCEAPEQPPHIKEMCGVISQYPTLARTAFYLKSQPWDFVVADCSMRTHSCELPPPLGPSHPHGPPRPMLGAPRVDAAATSEVTVTTSTAPFFPIGPFAFHGGPGGRGRPFRHGPIRGPKEPVKFDMASDVMESDVQVAEKPSKEHHQGHVHGMQGKHDQKKADDDDDDEDEDDKNDFTTVASESHENEKHGHKMHGEHETKDLSELGHDGHDHEHGVKGHHEKHSGDVKEKEDDDDDEDDVVEAVVQEAVATSSQVEPVAATAMEVKSMAAGHFAARNKGMNGGRKAFNNHP
jgi:hypothetical protein